MTRRILLDIDGISGNFIAKTLEVLEPLMGKTFHHDDVTDWDIMKSLGVPDEVSKEAYRRLGQPGVCASLPLYPGAKEGVARLHELGDVYAVTSPLGSSRTWTKEREEWLLEHLNIDSKHVVHTNAKYLCAGDWLIEDKTSALVKWESHHPNGKGIRWEQPYNMNDEWHGFSTRSWDRLIEIVQTGR